MSHKFSIIANAGQCPAIKCITDNEDMFIKSKNEYQSAFNRINFNNSDEKATNIEEIEKIIFVDDSNRLEPLIKFKNQPSNNNFIYRPYLNNNKPLGEEFYTRYRQDQYNSYQFIRHRDSFFYLPAIVKENGDYLLYDVEKQTYRLLIKGERVSDSKSNGRSDFEYINIVDLNEKFMNRRNNSFFIYSNGFKNVKSIDHFNKFIYISCKNFLEPIVNFRIKNKTFYSFMCNMAICIANKTEMRAEDNFYNSKIYKDLLESVNNQHFKDSIDDCVPNALNYLFQDTTERYFNKEILEQNRMYNKYGPYHICNFKYVNFKGKEFVRKTLAKYIYFFS